MGGAIISICKRRFFQLLVPYFTWSFISIAISGEITYARFENMFIHPDTSFWFLWVLFWINIIFVIGQWIAAKCHFDELFPISASCVILLGAMVGLELRLFGFQFFAYYFLFYTLGYMIHRFSFLQIKYNGALMGLFVIWLCLAWSWTMHELPSWMPTIPHVPTSLLQYTYRGGTAMMAILLLMGLAPKVLNGDKSYINKIVKEIGVVSLGCYTCHLVIMGYVANGVKVLMPNTNDWIIIVSTFFISLVPTFIIVELLKKNGYLAKILLGKI